MGQLNVNPGDLCRAADDYTELAAATARLSPLAAAEVQRIAATHGPMGYPTAVGIAMGMAAREHSVQDRAAQFGQNADRFTTRASTYRDEDRRAAAVYDALQFPQMHVDPKPPPKGPDEPWVVWWLPSPGADPAKYRPANTSRVEYVDEKGQWTEKDNGTGANQVILNGSLPDTEYLPGRRRARRNRAPRRGCGPTSMATWSSSSRPTPVARRRSKCGRPARSAGNRYAPGRRQPMTAPEPQPSDPRRCSRSDRPTSPA